MEILFILGRWALVVGVVLLLILAWAIWAMRDVLPGSGGDDEP